MMLKAVALTSFLGYKAEAIFHRRDLDRPGSKFHKREIVESCCVVDTPPIVVLVLLVTLKLKRFKLTTVWG